MTQTRNSVCRAMAPKAQRVALLVLCAWAVTTVPDCVRAGKPKTSDDVADFIFVGDSRPVFIRLRVRVQRKGFQQFWRAFVDGQFAQFDADNDGQLSPEEFSRAARALEADGRVLALDVVDKSPQDKRISRSEWRTAMKPQGRLQLQSNATTFTTQRGQLWSRLDTNNDSHLDLRELTAAADVLRKFDLDGDELITAQELKPYQSTLIFGVNVGQPRAVDDSLRMAQLVQIPAEQEDRAKLAQKLLAKYDGRPGDGGLDSKESSIPAKLIDKFDSDHNGRLNAKELEQLLHDPPVGCELSVELNKTGGQVSVSPTATSATTAKLKIDAGSDGSATVAFPGYCLRFEAAAGQFSNARGNYQLRFNNADQDKNEYLDKQEASREGLFRVRFDRLDRDGDGKLFFKEVEAFLDRQAEMSRSRIAVTSANEGSALFDVVDANRDGELSARELANTSKQLPNWDRDGNGRLDNVEMPSQFTISIARGSLSANGRGAAFRVPSGFPRPPHPTPLVRGGFRRWT